MGYQYLVIDSAQDRVIHNMDDAVNEAVKRSAETGKYYHVLRLIDSRALVYSCHVSGGIIYSSNANPLPLRD